MPPTLLLRRFTESRPFQQAVLAAVLLAGVLAGLETDAGLVARHGLLLHRLDQGILALFTVEIVLKLASRGSRWWEFFRDPWNLFDFCIVAVCLLPLHAGFAPVLRLVRVLRVLRLVSALPRLQILVGALLNSIPSMAYVAVLLLLHFYVYAVIGVSLFGSHDAPHFGGLGRTMLTLFQIVTLEGWADIMETQLRRPGASPVGVVAYFVSFILLGTMIILNLLIGVIMNGMQDAAAEAENAERARHQRATGHPSLGDELNLAERQLGELKKQLDVIRSRVR
ncbi:MAG: ion transporter [Verrucomicrobiota bacterium]